MQFSQPQYFSKIIRAKQTLHIFFSLNNVSYCFELFCTVDNLGESRMPREMQKEIFTCFAEIIICSFICHIKIDSKSFHVWHCDEQR